MNYIIRRVNPYGAYCFIFRHTIQDNIYSEFKYKRGIQKYCADDIGRFKRNYGNEWSILAVKKRL